MRASWKNRTPLSKTAPPAKYVPSVTRPTTKFWIGDTVYYKGTATPCIIFAVQFIGSREQPVAMYHMNRYINEEIDQIDAYEIELSADKDFSAE